MVKINKEDYRKGFIENSIFLNEQSDKPAVDTGVGDGVKVIHITYTNDIAKKIDVDISKGLYNSVSIYLEIIKDNQNEYDKAFVCELLKQIRIILQQQYHISKGTEDEKAKQSIIRLGKKLKELETIFF